MKSEVKKHALDCISHIELVEVKKHASDCISRIELVYAVCDYCFSPKAKNISTYSIDHIKRLKEKGASQHFSRIS